MNAKKREISETIDKRINEALFIKKVFIDHDLEKKYFLDQIKESLEEAK